MRDERRDDRSGRADAPVDLTGLDVTALAELDADLPTSAEAARRRAAATADPDAAAVLDALSATRRELAALPTPEVPPEVAARWTAALEAESRAPTCRTRTRGRSGARRSGRGLWAAAAVIIAVAAAGLAALVPRPAPAAPSVTRVELVALGRAAVGTMDLGDLADPARRIACLRAVAPEAADEVLLGGRRVVLDRRPAVLLVLATGNTGGLRLVTVDPGCGPRGGTVRAQLVVG